MTTTHSELSIVDKIAMVLGGGLILLGTVVLGFLDTFLGDPSAISTTNDAGQVVTTPAFPVEVRGTIIALGLVVFMLYAVYKLFTVITSPEARHTPEQSASTGHH
ncbi:hypothetical protein [Haladaptatus sp.]|uniref:hypothetical protein n=1 Tax=Haladaptatus sp. TaxID=1973141 RepID=UPI003C59C140